MGNMMNVTQVLRASRKYKYLALRTFGNVLIPINSKSVGISIRRHNPKMYDETKFFSYIPLNLNEYISMKYKNSFAKDN